MDTENYIDHKIEYWCSQSWAINYLDLFFSIIHKYNLNVIMKTFCKTEKY